MEKVWAQKSGLGWIGKHTNLITKEYGSWVFLGELILDIKLEYDYLLMKIYVEIVLHVLILVLLWH